MLKSLLQIAGVCAILLAPAAALAQAPSPEAVAAARELVTVSRAGDQFKAILPVLMQHLKPAIVQGREHVARDYDAIMPLLMETMSQRLSELTDAIAGIYALNFTVQEMNELSGFYRSALGQKLLERSPVITRQSMLIGQQFGARVVDELRGRIVDELRKRGHSI